uniref:Uncharacterized protein n=1 Tax=Oryza glumipatula TaxID=40148 RepID=A0A0D9YZX5_9ORYZ
MVPESGVGMKAVDYEVEQQDGGRLVKRKEADLTRGSHGGVPVATSSVGRDMLAVSDIQAETPYAQLNAASVPGDNHDLQTGLAATIIQTQDGKLADRADGEVSQPRELYVAHACWQLISLMSFVHTHPSAAPSHIMHMNHPTPAKITATCTKANRIQIEAATYQVNSYGSNTTQRGGKRGYYTLVKSHLAGTAAAKTSLAKRKQEYDDG